MSYLISLGYMGSETHYGLFSPFCQNTKVWKIKSHKTEKKCSCKVEPYWKLNPDIAGRLLILT